MLNCSPTQCTGFPKKAFSGVVAFLGNSSAFGAVEVVSLGLKADSGLGTCEMEVCSNVIAAMLGPAKMGPSRLDSATGNASKLGDALSGSSLTHCSKFTVTGVPVTGPNGIPLSNFEVSRSFLQSCLSNDSCIVGGLGSGGTD